MSVRVHLSSCLIIITTPIESLVGTNAKADRLPLERALSTIISSLGLWTPHLGTFHLNTKVTNLPELGWLQFATERLSGVHYFVMGALVVPVVVVVVVIQVCVTSC